jgi:hypothetical protein
MMDGNLRASTYLLYTDDEIISKTVECRPEVVAIDAPPALPLRRESPANWSKSHLMREARGCLIHSDMIIYAYLKAKCVGLTENLAEVYNNINISIF